MSLKRELRKFLGGPQWTPQAEVDGVAVTGRNLDFLANENFINAWSKAVDGNRSGWNGNPPDIRWRAHTALWAVKHGLRLEGDFVECGVFLGLLSLTICHALDFAKLDRQFYLFDTYNGLPDDGSAASKVNTGLYFDCYEQAKANFAPFPNAHLVRGILPGTLSAAPLDRIAYLSIDLNHAGAEMSVIHELWDRLSPSAIVLLDDYGWQGYEEQHQAWDDFAASKNVSIASLPTGQGLLIKPPN